MNQQSHERAYFIGFSGECNHHYFVKPSPGIIAGIHDNIDDALIELNGKYPNGTISIREVNPDGTYTILYEIE